MVPTASNCLPESPTDMYLASPKRREEWAPKLSQFALYRLHRTLKHPESLSITKLVRKSLGDTPVPPELKNVLEYFRCVDCAETPERPRRPKLDLPSEVVPDVFVSLDVRPLEMQNKTEDILVLIDHGDMILKLKLLPNRTALTALNAFYSPWTSVFYAPKHILVDRGAKLAAKLMELKLYDVKPQPCLTLTEALWGIVLKERSNRYLYKSIDRHLLQREYNTRHKDEFLLAAVELGWNYAQHNNNILSYYQRFGVIMRIIGSVDQSSRLSEWIALINLA